MGVHTYYEEPQSLFSVLSFLVFKTVNLGFFSFTDTYWVLTMYVLGSGLEYNGE